MTFIVALAGTVGIFVLVFVVAAVLSISAANGREVGSALKFSLLVACLGAIFGATKLDWREKEAAPVVQNTVPAVVISQPPVQPNDEKKAPAAEDASETVASDATATQDAPPAEKNIFQRAKKLVGLGEKPEPAEPVQEQPAPVVQAAAENIAQPVSQVQQVVETKVVEPWYKKVPPVPTFLVVAVIVIMSIFALHDLWNYKSYDDLRVTRLVFGVILCIGFLMFIPPLGIFVSWAVFIAITAATILLCTNHPHFAAGTLIAAVIFTDAFTDWSLIAFVSAHRKGTLIFCGAWVLAGIAEMLCVWWELEEHRAERREKVKDLFFKSYPRWQPANQVPSDVVKPATAFAIEHQGLFEDMSVHENSGALLARAPYGLLAFLDRAVNFIVPRAWRLMIDVTLRNRIEEYQRSAAAKTTIDFSTSDDSK